MHKYHKSYFQLIWPFYGFLQLYEVKLQKSHISVSLVHKYHKSCSELIWPFYGLLQLYEEKLQKSHISGSSVHKYHKSCSELHLTVLRLITTVWGKTSKISYLREFSAQVSQIGVLSSFDRFRAYSNCMRLNFKKSHISMFTAQVSQIVFFSSFDRFTYYNCMR